MATKHLTAVERARRKKIKALIDEAQQKASQYRDVAAGRYPELGMARLLDDLADVAQKYLEGGDTK